MEIKKDGLHVYAVCDYKENLYYFNTEYPIIKHNCPKSLLPVQIREQDGEKSIYFDISGKCSLLKWGEKREMGYDDCYKLLQGFQSLYKDLEEHLLSMDQISFRKEDIYINVNRQFQWAYLSERSHDIQKELEDLFQWILSLLDFEDKRALELIYRLYHSMKKEGLSLELLEDALGQGEEPGYRTESASGESCQKSYAYNIEKEEVTRNVPGMQEADETNAKIKRENTRIIDILRYILLFLLTLMDLIVLGLLVYLIYMRGTTIKLSLAFAIDLIIFILIQRFLNPFFSIQKSELSDDVSDVEAYPGKMYEKYTDVTKNKSYDVVKKEDHLQSEDPKKENRNSIFEELEKYWENSDETILLTSSMEALTPVLYSDRSRESVEMKVFPFYIGSEESLNQLSLKNRAVSRQHAVITKGEDEIFYLEDLNSKNGTKVDEKIVFPEKAVELRSGSKIIFADEAWNFVVGSDKGTYPSHSDVSML